MKTPNRIRIAVAIAFILSVFSSYAQDTPPADPPELVAKRDEHNRAVQRSMVPLLTNYLRSIEPLKQQLARAGKLDGALAIDNEIKKVTEQLKSAQAVANGAKVVNRSYITVFTEEHYKGKSYRLDAPGEYPELMSAGVPNDSVQSMKIPEGLTVTLYDSNLFKGEGERFTGDVSKMGAMKGVASSMKIK